jgi:DNA-binding NarL/FixJ family response regulator
MAEPKNRNIIIVYNNLVFIEGLKLLLATNTHYRVIEECENGTEIVVSEKLKMVNLIFIYIEIQETNRIEATRKICNRFQKRPLIAMSMLYKDRYKFCCV